MILSVFLPFLWSLFKIQSLPLSETIENPNQQIIYRFNQKRTLFFFLFFCFVVVLELTFLD